MSEWIDEGEMVALTDARLNGRPRLLITLSGEKRINQLCELASKEQ